MSAATSISWTTSTWNTVTGCQEVSAGCDLCYAKTFAERWRGIPGHHFENGFDVTLRPERLDLPTRWKKPRRIFVNSMSDLFHKDVPDEFIAKTFAAMAATPRHTYQLLTKRHGRMRALLNNPDWRETIRDHALRYGVDLGVDGAWPLPNLHLGVSVEDQKAADLRIPALLATPAGVRWISAEPLLGPVDLLGTAEQPGPAVVRTCFEIRTDYGTGIEYDVDDQLGLDWVVAGGESGRGARPMDLHWARDLRDQCAVGGIPFFFKQLGTPLAKKLGAAGKGERLADIPEDLRIREMPEG